MSAKSLSEDPAQWARDHTYHWFWGMVQVRRRDQKTIYTWWHEYSKDEAKQKELHTEVVRYRNKNFVSRFFIRLFNAQNMGLKLKLYDFFKKYDLNMFANIKRDSNMMNENGVSNLTDKLETEPTWFWNWNWNLFGKNKSCAQDDTMPKDSRSTEEKLNDEIQWIIEVWPPHNDAMTQYLAVPPLHFTQSELQAAQEGFVIDTETKWSALQEWKDFYQQHMAESGSHDEKAEAQLGSFDAIGSKYYPKLIGKQWRRISLKVHPDKGGDIEIFQRLNNLQELLTQEPLKTPETSPSALWNVTYQFRKKVNIYVKQRFENWHAAGERYVMSSWSDSEDSPDTQEQLKRAYYAGCEAAFRDYRDQREQAYRELMAQYAIQKAKYEENHPVAEGYAEVMAKRAQLEREWRCADLELYREGCQTFFPPVVNDLKEGKKEWLEERDDLQRKSENLKKKASDLEERLKKLEQNRLKLGSEEVALREQAGDLDSKQCERRKKDLLFDQKSRALHQESYQRLLELHESSKSSYENSFARHQKQTESAPKQIFSHWKAIYGLKFFDLVGCISPMSLAFWEQDQIECSQAIVYLTDLKKDYPGDDVPSRAAPKPPLHIMSSLALYHHLHNQAAHPTFASELEDKKGEREVALDGTDDELSSWMPPAAGDSAEIRQIQKGFSIYSPFPTLSTRITSLFTSSSFSGCTKKPEPFAEEGPASSLSKQADSLPVENPTVPKAALLTPGYDNVTGRNNHQDQKFAEPPTHSNSNPNSSSASMLGSNKKL